MASYRFCRTDDLALLVRACDACFPCAGLPAKPLSVEDLKRAARESDFWVSGCMVALEGDDPVGVVLAAKGATEACILGVGVRPDLRRRGHGRHLVTSLGAKLAILGPPRIVAEVPAGEHAARRFLERCGFDEQAELADFSIGSARLARQTDPGLVVPVTVDDLLAAGALGLHQGGAWSNRPAALERRKERLRGLAVASGERVEAWILFEEDEPINVVALRAGGALLGLLLGALASRAAGDVSVRGVAEADAPFAALRELGFVETGRTIRYATAARRA